MLFISLKDINEYLDNYLWGDKRDSGTVCEILKNTSSGCFCRIETDEIIS